ncbi:unnamed protein product, partial [Adineta steineri]
RIGNIFAAKNIRSKQMKNEYGAASSVAKDYYSKCADMSEMKMQFSSAAAAPSSAAFAMPTTEAAYDLMEDEAVTEEQSSRMYQKWSNRKK